MALIETIAPQMSAYRKQFHTHGDVEWVPYVMFFHPKNYSSPVVNTDSAGFRFSEYDGNRYSVAEGSNLSSARVIAGNSVAFGIGATSDKATLASRLMVHDSRQEPWLNFGGRAFNSAQELVLMTLYRHMLPKVDEIVLLSGTNDLLLAGLPDEYIQEHGAFYNCVRFRNAIEEGVRRTERNDTSFSDLLDRMKRPFGQKQRHVPYDDDRTLSERIDLAVDLTLRHLDGWIAIANDMGAKFTYVLQPIAPWVRSKGSAQEEALLRELASLPNYTTVRQDVLQGQTGKEYASALEDGARKRGISFVDMNPALREVASEDQWLFIDPAHMTDEGYDLSARLIIESTRIDASINSDAFAANSSAR